MYIIARPRGTNKTKELLEAANKVGGLVLTTDRRALRVKANSYGFEGLEIIDISDLLGGYYDATRPLFIHKAQEVFKEYLQYDFDLKLTGLSVTLEE